MSGICTWGGCDRPSDGSRPLCMAHRRRQYLGKPMDAPIRAHRRGMPLIERVMDQVARQGDCVVFTGSRTRAGYGKIGTKDGMLSAMKVVWEYHHGPVPKGMLIRHTCDNPPCVNLDHLIVGTQHDNRIDMLTRGRSSQAAFTPEQVRTIRADQRSPMQIAAEYGVVAGTIYNIKARRAYDWVS